MGYITKFSSFAVNKIIIYSNCKESFKRNRFSTLTINLGIGYKFYKSIRRGYLSFFKFINMVGLPFLSTSFIN